jgi:hypothetical protein
MVVLLILGILVAGGAIAAALHAVATDGYAAAPAVSEHDSRHPVR